MVLCTIPFIYENKGLGLYMRKVLQIEQVTQNSPYELTFRLENGIEFSAIFEDVAYGFGKDVRPVTDGQCFVGTFVEVCMDCGFSFLITSEEFDALYLGVRAHGRPLYQQYAVFDDYDGFKQANTVPDTDGSLYYADPRVPVPV